MFLYDGPARVLQGNVLVDDYGAIWVFGPQLDQEGRTKIKVLGDDGKYGGYECSSFFEGIILLMREGYVQPSPVIGNALTKLVELGEHNG